MAGCHPLDKLIGGTFPRFARPAEVRAFETGPWEQRIAVESTYDAVCAGAALNPERTGIYFLRQGTAEEEPVAYSFAEVAGRITQTANALHALGVGAGDVVSFMLPLLPEAVFVLFGGSAAGIVNPVNPMLEPAQIAGILKAAGSKVLVVPGPGTDPALWEKAGQVRGLLPELKHLVAVGAPGELPDDVPCYQQWIAPQTAERLVSGRTIRLGDVAAYFHTGGTTGLPKLVRHTHANHLFQAWGMGLLYRHNPQKSNLMGLPLFHVAGALSHTLGNLATGSPLVLLTPSGFRTPGLIANYWKLVARYRAGQVNAVPTALAGAANVPVDGADISSLDFCTGGGSAIPVEVSRTLEAMTGAPMVEVYGMTETASAYCFRYPDMGIPLGSVGLPFPYGRARTVKLDAEGRYLRDCAPEEIGVVTMSGPGVFSGYLEARHNQGAFVEPGWVNSGDLGRIDAAGFLWITGRAKDVIIRGSHNIDPIVVEEILYQHPAVALAAVVGQPDAHAGELPVAFVQPRPGGQATEAELLAFVRERCPERAANPVRLYFLEALPLTGVGKVFKPALRWDAAERVFRGLLAPLAGGGLEISVTVGNDARHGTAVTVQLAGAGGDTPREVENRVREVLQAFPLHHRIQWRREG